MSFILFAANDKKAAIFAFYLLSLFFLFGVFHDLLKKAAPNTFISSYSFLVPFGVFITIVLFFIIKKRTSANTIASYLRILLFVVTGFELAVLVYNLSIDKFKENDLGGNKVNFRRSPVCEVNKKPDIFFIVFDAYASSSYLEEEYGYKNLIIDSLFDTYGFFVSKLSKSNYNMTPFSLSSTLNLDYLKKGIEERPVSRRVFLQASQTLSKNSFFHFLSEQGYSLRNYGCFNMVKTNEHTKPFIDDSGHDLIDNQTLYFRIKRDIGWRFRRIEVLNKATGTLDSNLQYHIYRNKFNIDGLINELKKEEAFPRFIYMHVILPHEPFLYKADGTFNSDFSVIFGKADYKKNYLEQLIYTNTILKEIIPLASKKLLRDRVIIIEGDHGSRDDELSSKSFMNLNAIYFSDQNYSMLYDGISPVNTFRVVANKYFCQSFTLLKDSSILLKESLPFKE